eukprot:GHRQ01038671.1.p1 GENE.GHRQ01038671.1~~GHRQ01038671.1.p1  ORF type:complete len:124 (+),score=52.67 GHRQ01038671.1:534-905(+)
MGRVCKADPCSKHAKLGRRQSLLRACSGVLLLVLVLLHALLLLLLLLLLAQVPAVSLAWRKLSCHWTSTKKKQRKGQPGSKQILFNLSGAAKPGRCAAAVAQRRSCSSSGCCYDTTAVPTSHV